MYVSIKGSDESGICIGSSEPICTHTQRKEVQTTVLYQEHLIMIMNDTLFLFRDPILRLKYTY